MESLHKVLFADDTVLYGAFDTLENAKFVLNNYLSILFEWLTVNKLKLNVDKTKFLIFTLKRNFVIPEIKINGINIEYVTKITYLGVILDHKLSFRDHINLLTTKLARINGVIFSLKSFLPFHCLKSIYYSFAYSYLNNNVIIWGGSPKTVIYPLQIMQNKIIRNLAPHNLLHLHTSELYNHLNLLKINQLFAYRSLEFGFKWLHMHDYNMLNEERLSVQFHHVHNTRNQDRLRIPFPRLEKHKQFVLYNFVLQYNKLPDNLFNTRNFNYFKKYIFHHVKNTFQ